MKTLEEQNQELRRRIAELEEQIPIKGKRGDWVSCTGCGKMITLIMDLDDVRRIICDECAH